MPEPARKVLAGRSPCHRQGHRALSCDLLAGVSDVGGAAAAQAGLRRTASCSTAARKCRSRSAMSSRPASSSREYGVDQVRYFFLREVPFGQDGNYSHEAIVARINADLANDLGNLAQRSLSMIAKNCDGKVPACGALSAEDEAILAAADALLARMPRPSRGPGDQPGARCDLESGRRRQPLFRGAGAVGAARRPIRRAWGPCSM